MQCLSVVIVKKILLFLNLLVFACFLKAESEEPLKWNISIGVGAPNLSRYSGFINKTFKNKPDYNITGKGPFHFKVEYRPMWWLGLGLNVNHSQFKISYLLDNYRNSNGDLVPNLITIKNTSTAFNLRANLHLLNPEHYGSRGDIYWGLGLGIKAGKIKIGAQYTDQDATPSISFPNLLPIGFETTFGIKYYITPNIGAYAELGFAKSIIQIGATAAF